MITKDMLALSSLSSRTRYCLSQETLKSLFSFIMFSYTQRSLYSRVGVGRGGGSLALTFLKPITKQLFPGK